jgi:hypothetical protein
LDKLEGGKKDVDAGNAVKPTEVWLRSDEIRQGKGENPCFFSPI